MNKFVFKILKTLFENERTSVLWNLKSYCGSVCFPTLWKVLSENVFICVVDLAQKWVRNGVWFES